LRKSGKLLRTSSTIQSSVRGSSEHVWADWGYPIWPGIAPSMSVQKKGGPKIHMDPPGFKALDPLAQRSAILSVLLSDAVLPVRGSWQRGIQVWEGI
jgi:hypothetical protein